MISDGFMCLMGAELDLFSSVAFVDDGSVWFDNKSTSATRQKALVDIQRVYPSVLEVDDVLIITWDRVSETHIHNGKVILTFVTKFHKPCLLFT